MAQRLQWFREMPNSWLHWEPAFGGIEAHRHLRETLAQAECRVWAQDMAHALELTREPSRLSWNPTQWRRAREPMAAQEDAQVAMVWANMALHHEPLPGALLQRWYQLLQPDGFLMFSCLGPDSLIELRAAYARMGWPDPAHAFTDMHDWGDMLVACGFAEPVMDMERITLSFSSSRSLCWTSCAAWGATSMRDGFGGLRGQGLAGGPVRTPSNGVLPRDGAGRLLLTFEVVYGHAFKPQPRVPMEARAGGIGGRHACHAADRARGRTTGRF